MSDVREYQQALQSWAYSAVMQGSGGMTSMLFGRVSVLANNCGRDFVRDSQAAKILATKHVKEWDELLEINEHTSVTRTT